MPHPFYCWTQAPGYFPPSPAKRLDPWTLTLGKGGGGFGKLLGEGLNFRSLRKGKAGAGFPRLLGWLISRWPLCLRASSILAHKILLGWGNVNSFLAVLFSGDEPLDELLNYEKRTFLVRKNISWKSEEVGSK